MNSKVVVREACRKVGIPIPKTPIYTLRQFPYFVVFFNYVKNAKSLKPEELVDIGRKIKCIPKERIKNITVLDVLKLCE